MAGPNDNPINDKPSSVSSNPAIAPTDAAIACVPADCATSSMHTPAMAEGVAVPNFPNEPLLLGTYTPKIDRKGRMALPAKMRAQLGAGMVMARGQEKCVYLLPQNEFRRITARIQRASMGNKATRSYLRVFLSGAVESEPDKQGRVLVPQTLRSYAGLGDDIVVIGVGTRAEIWNKESWDAYLADQEEGYSDIADDVLPAMEW